MILYLFVCLSDMDVDNDEVTSRGTSRLSLKRQMTFADKQFLRCQEMREQNVLTDFVIQVEGEKIKCHRLVLASSSQYFRNMFSHDLQEKLTGELTLRTLKAAAVRDLIHYCYTGELEVDMCDIKPYLEAGHHLQLLQLIDNIDDFVAGNVDPSNCIGWFFYAEQYELKKVKVAAERVIIDSLPQVSSGPEFKSLNYNKVTDFLMKRAATQSGDALLQAGINWILSDEEERKQHISDLLDHVQLQTCTASYLKCVLLKHRYSLMKDQSVIARLTDRMLANCSVKLGGEENKMIVLGGLDNDMLVDKALTLDLVTGECQEIPLSERLKYGSAVCKTPLGIFIGGGGTAMQSSTATNSCRLFTVKNHTFKKLPKMQSSAYGSGAVCVENQIFVLGGLCDREDVMECFDLITRKWETCPNMLQKIILPIVSATNSTIFVVFNTCPPNAPFQKGNEISLQCYDIAHKTWAFDKPLPDQVTNTCGAKAITIGEHLYVVGGKEKLCLQYDVSENNWSILAPPSLMHLYPSVVFWNGKLILCGGIKGKDTGSTDVIEMYDLEDGSWQTSHVKLPVPMYLLFSVMKE